MSGYKRNVPHLLLYYISPPSEETVIEANQPHRYDYPYEAMAQADGESWNMPVNRSWVLQRDVMATVYLHAGQVHSYIKSELGMRGALNVSHISQNPSSFNEAFPELGGLLVLSCCALTTPSQELQKLNFLSIRVNLLIGVIVISLAHLLELRVCMKLMKSLSSLRFVVRRILH